MQMADNRLRSNFVDLNINYVLNNSLMGTIGAAAVLAEIKTILSYLLTRDCFKTTLIKNNQNNLN